MYKAYLLSNKRQNVITNFEIPMCEMWRYTWSPNFSYYYMQWKLIRTYNILRNDKYSISVSVYHEILPSKAQLPLNSVECHVILPPLVWIKIIISYEKKNLTDGQQYHPSQQNELSPHTSNHQAYGHMTSETWVRAWDRHNNV